MEHLAAYIRGLTFDGCRCLFVKTFEAQLDKTMPSLLLNGEKNEWNKAFEDFVSKGNYPATIAVEGSDLVFGLGVSYDEACKGEGVSVKPSRDVKHENCKADRDNVVSGKVALVTGGAQGFGEGIVRSLVQKGAFVFIADMNIEGATRLANELNEKAKTTVALGVAVNVCDEEAVIKMMDFVEQQTGSLDIFVSNAGVLRAGSVKEMPLKDFELVTNIDYKGFFICTKHASRQMAVQHEAAKDLLTDIIVISSKSGLEGSNKNGAYAGAKFGVIGLAQSFALELVKDGIKVNAICPGNFLDGPLWSDPVRGLFVQYLNTGKVPGAKTVADVRKYYESKVPMGRGCTSIDVMRALFYIVEQEYETGQAVPVTGGQVMLN